MRSLLPAFLLLLVACGQTSTETGQDPSSGEGKGEAAQPTVQQGQPENLMDDPRNEAVPVEPPLPTPTSPPGPLAPPTPAVKRSAAGAPLAAFPVAFRGRWGLVPADCEPGRSDAKGLMEVGVDTVRFYESRGTVRRLAQAGPDRLEATLAFTGEGQRWTSAQSLALGRGGRMLTREEQGPPISLRYARCPAS